MQMCLERMHEAIEVGTSKSLFDLGTFGVAGSQAAMSPVAGVEHQGGDMDAATVVI